MRNRTAGLSVLLALVAPTFAYAHGGHAHIMGTVSAVDASHIEVKEKSGKVDSLLLDDGTKYTMGKARAKQSDVAIGKRVVVHAAGEGNKRAAEVQIAKGAKK